MHIYKQHRFLPRFSAEKGEEGEKWINLLYDSDNGTLGLEVTEQPESGNVAKMNVTYMKAEVAEIYAGIIRFDGLNTLDALKTNNRDSFVGAINELVSGKVGANDIVNGKDASYRVTDLLKWVAGGLEKSNSVNYPGLDYISAMFTKCLMHFAVMVSKSRSRL